MVDRLVRWAKWDTEGKGWSDLIRLTDKVIDLSAPDFRPFSFRESQTFPVGHRRLYAKEDRPKEVFGREVIVGPEGARLVRGERITYGTNIEERLGSGIVAASKEARILTSMGSIIIAGGNLKIRYRLHTSIVICDGDVELTGSVGYSIIIARGKVIRTRGSFTHCMVRSERSLRFPEGKTIEIKEGTPDPLAFVKFFELSDVGLIVSDREQREEPALDGVRLKDVRKGSPFASGLRAGDIVTALDETKVASIEDFRRQLRRKLAQGGPTINFTLQRSKETLKLSFPVKD
jgi:hypothetical protein